MRRLDCILLIDDNDDDNFFHKHVIKKSRAAHEIQTATTGERALEYLKEARLGSEAFKMPDLIFLDINMPGMNGFEFLEKALDENLLHTHNQVVVVMLTSSLNPGDEKFASENFANVIKGFHNKPLTKEMLAEIIENNC